MSFSDYGREFVEKDYAERKQRYLRFLQSPEWRAACRRVHERFNHLCVICRSSESLQVHHSCYEYPNRPEAGPEVGRGWLPVADAGLVLMCAECHHGWHRFWRTGRLG